MDVASLGDGRDVSTVAKSLIARADPLPSTWVMVVASDVKI
jgi:hypothetical protein